MAKLQAAETAPGPARDGGERDWEARDAMHTLLRAGEIASDKPLLRRVKKRAATHARNMSRLSKRAARLAEKGAISDTALARLGKRIRD